MLISLSHRKRRLIRAKSSLKRLKMERIVIVNLLLWSTQYRLSGLQRLLWKIVQ